MTTVVVLGAGGELGQSVVAALSGKEGLSVVATYHSSHGPELDGVRFSQLSLGSDAGDLETCRAQLDAILAESGAAAVVNCAVCKHDPSQDKAAVEDFIVTRSVEVVGRACAARGARLLQLSTDVVFDGAQGAYAEDAPTSALLWYGECKARMEQGLLKLAETSGLQVCLMRTSLILTLEPSLETLLGANPRRSKCAHFCVSRAVAAHKEGKRADFFTDEIRSVSVGQDLAAAIADMAALPGAAFADCCGVLNLVASEAVSRLQLAEALLEYYGPQLDALEGGRPSVVGSLSKEIFKGARPLDCSLKAARYEALREKHALTRLRPALEALAPCSVNK